ncbi:IclR family transcriptional regulator [Streptomyces sp. 4N124]|uniref:IclR family transcriptional regulator n=1 Tax=Streptomyces sp. 4N124 TaxID=3457420 RepID=UPI003FD0CC79
MSGTGKVVGGVRAEAANDTENGAGGERAEKAKRPSQPPSQTLVRGLSVLRAVAHQPRGLTVAEIAARTGLHRTVVHRLAGTLAAEGFLAKNADGAYVPGGELHTLAGTSRPTLAEFIQPLLQQLADRYGGTAILFFPEPDCVVAVATAVPQDADYHLAYRKGSRQPLDRGAAPCAIRAGRAPADDDSDAVREARRRGWVTSHGAVEPGAHAVAAPLARDGDVLDACVMFVSHRQDRVDEATPEVVSAARAARAFLLGPR